MLARMRCRGHPQSSENQGFSRIYTFRPFRWFHPWFAIRPTPRGFRTSMKTHVGSQLIFLRDYVRLALHEVCESRGVMVFTGLLTDHLWSFESPSFDSAQTLNTTIYITNIDLIFYLTWGSLFSRLPSRGTWRALVRRFCELAGIIIAFCD